MLSLARKYGLYLSLAHQTWSQVNERLQGALQNTVSIAFKLGRSDAEWAAPRFGRHDPYSVKHNVIDPEQIERTHPIYFSPQETFEEWTKDLESLNPREAFVKLGQQTTRIKTLTVPRAKTTRADVHQLMEEYAARLLTPKEQIAETVDQPVTPAPTKAVRKVRIED